MKAAAGTARDNATAGPVGADGLVRAARPKTGGYAQGARAWKPFKPFVFVVCLGPFAYLVFLAASGGLGVNPIETITLSTGRWTLRFLLITLAVTPVRRLFHWNAIVRYRRMLGLFAFFYGMLHLSTYVVLDQFFDWRTIVEDVTKRPFIMAGMSALLLLTPLAVTSTQGWIRRLGRRWTQLHMLIYPASMLGVLHFVWKVKSDLRSPTRYAIILALLLAFRLVWTARHRRAS